jgi:hypothetical protein
MSYLYGDSTPSPLEVNFVDFLGDCLDFCAQLLASTESMRRETANGDALRRASQADAQRLERLASAVATAVKDASTHGDDHTTRCGVAIVRSSSDLVRIEIDQVNSRLHAELAQLDATMLRERHSCVKALETLLLRHHLPQSRMSLTLQARANGPYGAWLRVGTPFGLGANLELDVPAAHVFGHALRVDRVIDRLEVQAPDTGGWLHKEGKIRAHRLEKLYVAHLDLDAEQSCIKLRAAADGSGPGFDVLVRAEAPVVRLVRVGERDTAPDEPFEVEDADAVALLKFMEKLETPARELVAHRKALVQANLDDRPLGEHDQPSVLAERLVAAVAPVTQEIARRSPSTTELVLKRMVSGGRREEIFVTKADLQRRIEHLPLPLRAVFDPLGLGAANGPAPLVAAAPARPASPETPASPEASRTRTSSGSPAPPSPAPPAKEPATLVMARRAPGPDAPTAEPPRPSSTPSQQPVFVSHQVEVGAAENTVDPSASPAVEAPRRE